MSEIMGYICFPKASLKAFGRATTRATTLAAATALLSACAAAPGMRMPAAQAPENAFPAVETVSITADLLAGQQVPPVDASAAVQELRTPPKPYVLGPGDVLNITVWDYPQLNLASTAAAGSTGGTGGAAGGQPVTMTDGYTVAADGTLQFAFVGTLKVAGLTPAEARWALVKRLGQYIRDPQVVVRVQTYRSQRIYLDGAVTQKGPQPIDDIPMSLSEALARAGGLLPTGDAANLTVIRGDKRIAVNIPRLLEQGVPPTQLFLANGDLLRVAPRDESKVFVMGEVNGARALEMRDGRLSLNEALGEVGGMNAQSAAARQVFVVRPAGANGKPQVFHLDARSPVALAYAEGFALRPKDVVFVDSSQLVRWNRVISLVLPTTSGVISTAVGVSQSSRN